MDIFYSQRNDWSHVLRIQTTIILDGFQNQQTNQPSSHLLEFPIFCLMGKHEPV